MSSVLRFITWPAIAGILAALVILDRLALPGLNTPTSQGEGVSSYSPAVSAASPSVVNIYTATVVRSNQNPMLSDSFFRNFAPVQTPRQRIEESLGSGVIMSPQGHILTNNHVIAGADAIRVLLVDGRSANAVVIGTDQATEENLAAFGNKLGLAFQIADDVMDYDGDSETMGKNVGDDLAEGKPTLPLIHARAATDEAGQTVIDQAVRIGHNDNLDEVLTIIRSTGALGTAMDTARFKAESALQEIAGLARHQVVLVANDIQAI